MNSILLMSYVHLSDHPMSTIPRATALLTVLLSDQHTHLLEQRAKLAP
jgi:hypothetical protein